MSRISLFQVANASTQFGESLPAQQLVLNEATNEIFKLTAAELATDTLTTAATVKVPAQTGNDVTVVSGTAGTSGNLAQWNADGDAVDASLATTNVMTTNTAQEFTAQKNFNEAALSDAASISWDLNTAQTATVTLGGNRTLANPTNMNAGATYILRVVQDGTGSRTLAYGTAYDFPGGTAPTLSTGANAVDILTFYSDGTSMLGVAQLNFS